MQSYPYSLLCTYIYSSVNMMIIILSSSFQLPDFSIMSDPYTVGDLVLKVNGKNLLIMKRSCDHRYVCMYHILHVLSRRRDGGW